MTEPAEPHHVPVLLREVIGLLTPQTGEIFIDATVGAGGHSRAVAALLGPTGRLLGLDQDATMLDLARPRLAGLPITLIQGNFEQVSTIARSHGCFPVDGLLADLGFCSDQMDDPTRGLSFRRDGPLDMRLDPTVGESAADLLRRIDEQSLADLIFQYGEERHSRRIARRIVEARTVQPIRTTQQLANLVRRCVPKSPGHHIDPATRTFQALRIAVNDELGALERFLAQLPDLIRPGGRVAIISFHSLEDRLVKHALRESTYWQLMVRKPIQASDEEQRRNPRCRSAKLRGAIRLGANAKESV